MGSKLVKIDFKAPDADAVIAAVAARDADKLGDLLDEAIVLKGLAGVVIEKHDARLFDEAAGWLLRMAEDLIERARSGDLGLLTGGDAG